MYVTSPLQSWIHCPRTLVGPVHEAVPLYQASRAGGHAGVFSVAMPQKRLPGRGFRVLAARLQRVVFLCSRHSVIVIVCGYLRRATARSLLTVRGGPPRWWLTWIFKPRRTAVRGCRFRSSSIISAVYPELYISSQPAKVSLSS